MLLAQIARDKAAAEARGDVVEDAPEATGLQRGDEEEDKVVFNLTTAKPAAPVVKVKAPVRMVSPGWLKCCELLLMPGLTAANGR